MTQRLILMSDIHGNLPALRAVIDALPDHDAVLVAGDLCLDGGCPAEVVDLLRDLAWESVMGNTDRDIVDLPESLDSEKRQSTAWTRARLGDERVGWLAGLPFSRRLDVDQGDTLLVVHANPLNLEDHLAPGMSQEALQPYLDAANATIVAFGHHHIPYARPVRGTLLLDVASVGHPKDWDLRASFAAATWAGGCRSIEQFRVPYDVEEAVHLIKESGMPDPEKQVASLLKASY